MTTLHISTDTSHRVFPLDAQGRSLRCYVPTVGQYGRLVNLDYTSDGQLCSYVRVQLDGEAGQAEFLASEVQVQAKA